MSCVYFVLICNFLAYSIRVELMASARLFFNYGNSNSRFPPLSACSVLPRTRGIYVYYVLDFLLLFQKWNLWVLCFSACWRNFERHRSSMSRWRRRNQCCQEEAHWWKCFGSSEVIDSSESRQNYQDGEGFSDLSGYPVESRTHPRGYLSESPFRGQVHKSGTSSIRTAEHWIWCLFQTSILTRMYSLPIWSMIQSPLPDIDLTDVRSVSMMIRSLRFQIKVTDHTSLTRSLVSPDTRPPSTVPSIAQPDKGIGSNQVYAPDIAVASTSISDGIERAPNRLRVKSLIRTRISRNLFRTGELYFSKWFSRKHLSNCLRT